VDSNCHWCEMMVHKTLKDKDIQANLTDIVTVVVDVHTKLPKEFYTKLTPGMFFIDVKSKKVYGRILVILKRVVFSSISYLQVRW